MADQINFLDFLKENISLIATTIWVAFVGAFVSNYFFKRGEKYKIKFEKQRIAKGILTELRTINHKIDLFQANNKPLENLVLNDFIYYENGFYFNSRKEILYFDQELIEEVDIFYQNVIRVYQIQKSIKNNIPSTDILHTNQLLMDVKKQSIKLIPKIKKESQDISILSKLISIWSDKKIEP
jgi:hypothetical protein